MKKHVLVIVLSTISLAGVSQNKSLGINAGFGHSWIKNHRDVQFNPHGNVGLSFIRSTKTSFGFGADLKFSFEGGQEEFTTGGVKYEHTTDLNYIRIPVKAIWFGGKYGQKIRPKIHLGPSFGFLVGANDKTINTTNGNVVSYRSDGEYHNFDIGIQGGVGFNYRIVKNTWFTTDLNYYNGLKGITQNNTTSSPRYSNNHVALNVGVNWGIGK